jgi:hypothetical protein
MLWDANERCRVFGVEDHGIVVPVVARQFGPDLLYPMLSLTLDMLCLRILFEQQPCLAAWLPAARWAGGLPDLRSHWLWGFGLFEDWHYAAPPGPRHPQSPHLRFTRLIHELNQVFHAEFPSAGRLFERAEHGRQEYRLTLGEGAFASNATRRERWVPVREVLSLVKAVTGVEFGAKQAGELQLLLEVDPGNLAALVWLRKSQGARGLITAPRELERPVSDCLAMRVSALARMLDIGERVIEQVCRHPNLTTRQLEDACGFRVAPDSLEDHRALAQYLLECLTSPRQPEVQPPAIPGRPGVGTRSGPTVQLPPADQTWRLQQVAILQGIRDTCPARLRESRVICTKCGEADREKCERRWAELDAGLRGIGVPGMTEPDRDQLVEGLLLFIELVHPQSDGSLQQAWESWADTIGLEGLLRTKHDTSISRISLDAKLPGREDKTLGETVKDDTQDIGS